MSRKDKVLIIALCVVVFLILLPLTILSLSPNDCPSPAYSRVVACMEEGNYKKAYALLRLPELWNDKSTQDLRVYCRAQMELADGRLDDARLSLRFLSDDYAKQDYAVELRNQVFEAYSAQQKAAQEVLEAQRKQEEAEARRGKPYVGMPEKWIDITSWGAHGNLRHNSTLENGTYYVRNLYDFYQNGHLRYTVICLRGTVRDVYDWGDSFGAVSGSSSYSGYVDTSDPYDAQDYAHPDDFYYDHYEDFWDFEDAEEYYYDN